MVRERDERMYLVVIEGFKRGAQRKKYGAGNTFSAEVRTARTLFVLSQSSGSARAGRLGQVFEGVFRQVI